jgi:hypothetical protein
MESKVVDGGEIFIKSELEIANLKLKNSNPFASLELSSN